MYAREKTAVADLHQAGTTARGLTCGGDVAAAAPAAAHDDIVVRVEVAGTPRDAAPDGVHIPAGSPLFTSFVAAAMPRANSVDGVDLERLWTGTTPGTRAIEGHATTAAWIEHHPVARSFATDVLATSDG